LAVNIRSYRPGDETAQAAIYNEAAARLSRFKPTTSEEVHRRCRDRSFDPETRLYAEADGEPVGYVMFHANGRIGFPWCKKGHESAALPLFERAMQVMKTRGMRTAFAAYRADWTPVKDFFLANGFHLAREIVNFLLDQADMPTRPGRRANPLTPLRPTDVPAIFAMGAGVLQTRTVEELEQYLFHNPYFPPEAVYVTRSRDDDSPVAVGILVVNLTYADPTLVDANMPCFRLGAFGSEGMTTKRINGLFSFLTRDERNASALALDLMSHASFQLEEDGGGSTTLAAQVPSDCSYLLRFYQSYFRKQGSFPIFARAL
jgi:hypothetical protein